MRFSLTSIYSWRHFSIISTSVQNRRYRALLVVTPLALRSPKWEKRAAFACVKIPCHLHVVPDVYQRLGPMSVWKSKTSKPLCCQVHGIRVKLRHPLVDAPCLLCLTHVCVCISTHIAPRTQTHAGSSNRSHLSALFTSPGFGSRSDRVNTGKRGFGLAGMGEVSE